MLPQGIVLTSWTTKYVDKWRAYLLCKRSGSTGDASVSERREHSNRGGERRFGKRRSKQGLIERLETWKRNGSQLGNATWPLLVLLALLGLFGLEGIQEVLLSHDGREIEYIECMIAVSETLPCELRAMPEAPFIQHDGSPSSCSTPTT